MSEKENSILSVLEMIDARISHIEDIESDNREIIIKLVKQTNQIVKFLKNLEVELIEDLDVTTSTPELPLNEDQNYIKPSKIKHIKELIEEFMDKYTDLADLEKELRKYKDQITPGTIGES